MALPAQESVTLGNSAPAPISVSSSSSVSSTPFSRRSSKSSDQQSLSSSPSAELPAVGSPGFLLKSTHVTSRGSSSTEDSIFSMARQSNSVDDESDPANRRSSGRARKLTSKYQALTGTKLLPVDSANNAPEFATMLADECKPIETLATFEATPGARPSEVKSPLMALSASTEQTPFTAKQRTEKARHVKPHAIEESSSRSLRRERKPSAKFLEATAAQTLEKSPPSSTKDGTLSKVLRSASRNSVSKLEDTAEHGAAYAVREQSPSPVAVVALSDPDLTSKALSNSPSDEPRERQKPGTSRKRFVSSKKTNAPPATLVLKHWILPADDSLPPAAPTLDHNSIPATEQPAQNETKPPETSITEKSEPDRSSTKIASSSRKRSAPPSKEEPQPKIFRLSLKPPKRPSNLRFSVSSTENVADMQSSPPGKAYEPEIQKEQLVNNSPKKIAIVSPAPAKDQTERSGPALTVDAKKSDPVLSEVQNSHPRNGRGKSGEAGCNLFCLSPSSRILAFAQIAAESSDSDDEDESRNDFDKARTASRDLYEKWMAIGRERFCVCNTPVDGHAHPSNTKPPTSNFHPTISNELRQTTVADAALPDLPQDVNLAFPLPPVNSIMPVSEGRKVSALYNALTDTAMPLGPIRRSPIDFSTPPPSESVHPMTFEQRMREDFRALEAIRQQAALEGVRVRYDMNYDQIKSLLDQHRIEASSGIQTKGKGKGAAL